MGEHHTAAAADFLEALMTGADPVESWLTDVRSPQPGSATPSSSSMLPPASPLAPAPITTGTSTFSLSPRPSPRPNSARHVFPSPSAARRGCFGPRHNGVAYPLPRSRAAMRDDDEDAPRASSRRRRAAERGTQSVPTHLMHDFQVPPIQLPGTLHGMGGTTTAASAAAASGSSALHMQAIARSGGTFFKQEPMPELPVFGSSLLGGLGLSGDGGSGAGGAGGGAASTSASGGQVALGSGDSPAAASDWEDVTRMPLQLDSDDRVFQVPSEWAQKFRSVRDVNERLKMLDELEKLGQKFVEEMKKERSDEYYARMHAIRDLSAPTKVTIRGRIHSKLNPFVKDQNAKVHREITVWLLKQIPFD